jgi:hypothetical protein
VSSIPAWILFKFGPPLTTPSSSSSFRVAKLTAGHHEPAVASEHLRTIPFPPPHPRAINRARPRSFRHVRHDPRISLVLASPCSKPLIDQCTSVSRATTPVPGEATDRATHAPRAGHGPRGPFSIASRANSAGSWATLSPSIVGLISFLFQLL